MAALEEPVRLPRIDDFRSKKRRKLLAPAEQVAAKGEQVLRARFYGVGVASGLQGVCIYRCGWPTVKPGLHCALQPAASTGAAAAAAMLASPSTAAAAARAGTAATAARSPRPSRSTKTTSRWVSVRSLWLWRQQALICTPCTAQQGMLLCTCSSLLTLTITPAPCMTAHSVPTWIVCIQTLLLCSSTDFTLLIGTGQVRRQPAGAAVRRQAPEQRPVQGGCPPRRRKGEQRLNFCCVRARMQIWA